MRSTIVPNVMDFDSPPPEPDGYGNDLRRALDIEEGEHLLLQPTRVVPRKRIELAIVLAHWLELPCTIVIPHCSGDEGDDYESFIARFAGTLGVRVLFAEKWFAPERKWSEDGSKIYGLADAYQQADLVTYPSATEGFGNAFLEAIYYKRPLVMCSYEIFKTDIEPKGFHVVAFEEGFITDLTIERVRTVLRDRELVRLMTEKNYDLGRRYFSYTTLRSLLEALIGRSVEGLF
jgi:glycosyltransferase involved in cell wall biosynthesis